MSDAVILALIGAAVSTIASALAAVVSIFNNRKLNKIENGMKAEAWHAGRDDMRIELEQRTPPPA